MHAIQIYNEGTSGLIKKSADKKVEDEDEEISPLQLQSKGNDTWAVDLASISDGSSELRGIKILNY